MKRFRKYSNDENLRFFVVDSPVVMTFFEREFLHLKIILVPLPVLPSLGLRHHQEVLARLGSSSALALDIGPAGMIISTLQQATVYWFLPT